MQRKIYIVIVAGGSGTRMGGDTPKQFLEIDGVPVLQRTMERFISAIPDIKIITVLPKEHFNTWKDLCLKHSFFCPQTLVEGGLTRFHSVRNALEKIPDGAIVGIHDGVRPFISVALIRKLCSMMETETAVAPMLKITDSLKFADGSFPEPDRNNIVSVQTPQMFRSEDIKAAYEQAYNPIFTDDVSVAVRNGIHVCFTEGEKLNIKLTTRDDLILAGAILGAEQPAIG